MKRLSRDQKAAVFELLCQPHRMTRLLADSKGVIGRCLGRAAAASSDESELRNAKTNPALFEALRKT